MRKEELSPVIVVIFTGVILLFVAFYLTLLRVDAYLQNSAIDACASFSKFEKTDKGQSAVISYPIKDVYQECLIKKGL